jgi:hypothetical protein
MAGWLVCSQGAQGIRDGHECQGAKQRRVRIQTIGCRIFRFRVDLFLRQESLRDKPVHPALVQCLYNRMLVR